MDRLLLLAQTVQNLSLKPPCCSVGGVGGVACGVAVAVAGREGTGSAATVVAGRESSMVDAGGGGGGGGGWVEGGRRRGSTDMVEGGVQAAAGRQGAKASKGRHVCDGPHLRSLLGRELSRCTSRAVPPPGKVCREHVICSPGC